ncbi:MAG: L-serine ammonia-lyase [Ghiorsea sp.]
MFISALDLFKIGIGPSSSHTMGPMLAAKHFIDHLKTNYANADPLTNTYIQVTLRGSLAYTGKGHATDTAVALGLHGYTAESLANHDVASLIDQTMRLHEIVISPTITSLFSPVVNIDFSQKETLPEHPNGMIFQLVQKPGKVLQAETYFSIGGGFISTLAEINQVVAPLPIPSTTHHPYPFESAQAMLDMSKQHNLSIAQMKLGNECTQISKAALYQGLENIIHAMQQCIEQGLTTNGTLPGGLEVARRAQGLFQQLQEAPESASVNDWLCAYAMAVNEENAAGHMVVTAPTNGAAGVIPAVLHNFLTHEGGTQEQAFEFLLTAAAIGGIIKHNSSISGAEVGCQGEVGSAASMAAAGLCAARGGTSEQIENAAEIALEHHLGMTCDPVKGLVQIPCIERNGFGAIKAHTAASLALRGSGEHLMPLDNCIAAMKQTGQEMSDKYKETSLGGLAVSITEC